MPDAAELRNLERIEVVERSRRKREEVVGTTGDERAAGVRTRDFDHAIGRAVAIGRGVQIVLLVAEDELHHRIAGRVELRHEHGLKASARGNGDGQELVGLIQQRPAVTRGTRPGLEIRRVHAEIRREILEEAASALLGRRAPGGQFGRVVPGEREHQELEGAVEARGSLKARNQIQFA